MWRERLAWLWTHYVGFGVVAGTFVSPTGTLGLRPRGLRAAHGDAWVSQKQYVDRSRSSVTELRRSHDELALANKRLRGLLEDNQALLGRMHRSYLSTITSLARTIEAKDPYTGGHTERVAQIARMLAVELGFDDAQLRAVDVGSVIHDIGKIGIPDHILLKPGKLDPEELAEMRRHPEISSYIVAELELPAIVKQMVRGHHERYDGKAIRTAWRGGDPAGGPHPVGGRRLRRHDQRPPLPARALAGGRAAEIGPRGHPVLPRWSWTRSRSAWPRPRSQRARVSVQSALPALGALS